MEYGLDILKTNVQQKFSEIRAALHMREKLLLRQLDVIVNTQQMTGRGSGGGVNASLKTMTTPTDEVKDTGEIRFIAEQESELLAAIRSFGRFQLDNMNLALQDVYLKNEDYIAPADDHETMYKCLQEPTDIADMEYDLVNAQPESIVVDFSRNKSLVEDNAKLMNKSIINITLQEAKDLIRKAKLKRDTYVPPLNLEELDDELESSIAEAVSSLGRETNKSSSTHTCVEREGSNKPKSKKQRFKPKITINNCNGTINLRNIASLTINCANEEAVSAEIPLPEMPSADSNTTTEQSSPTETTASSSNYSSNASSRSQSKKQSKGSKKSSNKVATKSEVAADASGTHAVGVDATTATTSSSTTTTVESAQPTSTNSESYCYAADEDVCDEDADADPDAGGDANDTHFATCEFYNRLLNEIKKSLKEKPVRYYDNVHSTSADSTSNANYKNNNTSNPSNNSYTTDQNSNASNASHIQPGKRLILKNFENLKIVLEANSGDEDTFHPVQIEQWLAEIISEADLEPMQNTDILEHSKINNESTN